MGKLALLLLAAAVLQRVHACCCVPRHRIRRMPRRTGLGRRRSPAWLASSTMAMASTRTMTIESSLTE